MSSSDTEDSPSKAKKKQCVTFEPQAWRKTLCKNCFKTREEHVVSSEPTSPRQATSGGVHENDDVVVISRRERTPVNEVILNRDDEDPLAKARARRSTSPSVFQTPVFRRTDSMPNVSSGFNIDSFDATTNGSSGSVSKSQGVVAIVGGKTGKNDADAGVEKIDPSEVTTGGKKTSSGESNATQKVADKSSDKLTKTPASSPAAINNKLGTSITNKTVVTIPTGSGKAEPEVRVKQTCPSDLMAKATYPTRGKSQLAKSLVTTDVKSTTESTEVGTILPVPGTEKDKGPTEAVPDKGHASATLTSEVITNAEETTSVSNVTRNLATTRPEAKQNAVDIIGSAIISSSVTAELGDISSATRGTPCGAASSGGCAVAEPERTEQRNDARRRDEDGTAAAVHDRTATEIVGAPPAASDVKHQLNGGTKPLNVGGSSEQPSAATDDIDDDGEGSRKTGNVAESYPIDVGRAGERNNSYGTAADEVPAQVVAVGGTEARTGDRDVTGVRHGAGRGRHESSTLLAAESNSPECTRPLAANDLRSAAAAESPDENNSIANEVSSVTSASLEYLRTLSSKSTGDAVDTGAPSSDNVGHWSPETLTVGGSRATEQTGSGYNARASSPVDESVDASCSSSQRARAEATIVLTANTGSVKETGGGIYVVSGSDLAQSPGSQTSTSDSTQWLDADTGRQTGYRISTSDDFIDTGSRLGTTSGGETSLFHHVPGNNDEDDRTGSGRGYWDQETSTASGQPYYDSDGGTRSPGGTSAASGGNGAATAAASRRRRRRIISSDDSSMSLTDPAGMMSASEFARSEAMMEGTRLLMDSLREKVAILEDKCEKLDREKLALSDLLVAKKTDYDRMKDRCNQTIGDLEDEVQRLKSEKARLLDRLQLPESERASLAAEENEIAELKRRLEDYEIRYGDAVVDNEDLRQEVRDLQLAMAELQDQFRDDETVELRDLQRELEATAKACRIAQFKLRKAERRCDQLEQDRIQADEKVRSLENCLQGSDDKRRLRLLEDDLRKAKEAAVRLHEDVERTEERRQRHQDDLDRVKNLLNESENRRLILQNQLDNAQSELLKLREQLKFEGRLDLLKPSVERPPTSGTGSVEMATAVAQLTRDLAASEERENDLREQLKYAEQEIKTIRKKLSDAEEEVESMSLQLRKLTSAKRGSSSSSKLSCSSSSAKDAESATQREAELRLQMELTEQEVTVLRRKLDVLQSDNENLLTAVKYLRAKLEGSANTVKSSAVRDSTSTSDLLASVINDTSGSVQEAGLRNRLVEVERENEVLRRRILGLGGSVETSKNLASSRLTEKDMASELEAAKKTISELSTALERSKTRVDQTAVSIQSADVQGRVEELERLLTDERRKVENSIKESKSKETELLKIKDDVQAQLTSCKKDLEKTRKELETAKSEAKKSKDGAKSKPESTQKQVDDLRKLHDCVETELAKCKDELKAADTVKGNFEMLQKTYSELKESHEKLLKEIKEKEKSSPKTSFGAAGNGTVGKEPATWRWDKQELERQIKELKKRNDDLMTSQSSGDGKKTASKTDAQKDGDCSKCCAEKTDLRSKLDQIQKELDKAKKEKESKDKKDDAYKAKDDKSKTDATKTELKSEIKRLEQELELAKAKTVEEEAQKTKMAAELKMVNEKNGKSGLGVGGLKKNEDSKAITVERDSLAKEKQKLIDDLSKLKKEAADADKQRKMEKEELEKNCKENNKIVEKLQAELEGLRAQLAAANSSTNSKPSTSGVTIPVQHEKSTARNIPIQKLNGIPSTSRSTSAQDNNDIDSSKHLEEMEKTFRAERAGLEESHRAKVKVLEEQTTRTREQLAAAKKESEKVAAESKKALAEVRSRYEKELESWSNDRDQLKKAEKQVEEFRSRISVLDKSVEDINSKLKAEEAKRREAENKAKLSLLDASKQIDNKSSTSPVEEKPAAVSTGAPNGAKLSDFRSKFEKFGGSGAAATGVVSKPGSTPGPIRRMSGSAGATDSTGGDSMLSDLQRQLAELEKSRAKDRQELLDKIASQKKDFDSELQDLKKRNTQLDARSQELAAVQKNVVDLRCQLDEERTAWNSEKSRLQMEIDEVLKKRDEVRIKADGLAAEVAALKSVVPGDDVKSSKSKSSMSNSSTLSSATKTSSPSVVIPVRRLGTQSDDGNSASASGTTTEPVTPVSGAASPAAATSGEDVKARRSLFAPVSSLKSTGSLTSSKETRNIPINKLSRPPTPRI